MKPQLSTDLLVALVTFGHLHGGQCRRNALETRPERGIYGRHDPMPDPGESASLGFAVTVKMRCSSPPPLGRGLPGSHGLVAGFGRRRHRGWWLLRMLRTSLDAGSLVGAVHCAVLRSSAAWGSSPTEPCGMLPTFDPGFRTVRGIAVSLHAYAHIVSVGDAVRVEVSWSEQGISAWGRAGCRQCPLERRWKSPVGQGNPGAGATRSGALPVPGIFGSPAHLDSGVGAGR